MTFRKNPGFTSSRPRMFMFGITTLMFALGIAALVLVNIFNFKATYILFYENGLFMYEDLSTYYYAWGTITCLMVRLLDASCSLLDSINGCSVYSMRCYLRLAHCGPLEQKQARHCHSSALHHWNHRCMKEISQLDIMCSSGTIDHSCCWVWPCHGPSQHILVLRRL